MQSRYIQAVPKLATEFSFVCKRKWQQLEISRMVQYCCGDGGIRHVLQTSGSNNNSSARLGSLMCSKQEEL